METEKLQDFTMDLSKKVTEMSSKIKNQSLILESIENQAECNSEIFSRNQGLFGEALNKLEKDKRGILIVFLLAVIAVLIYILCI